MSANVFIVETVGPYRIVERIGEGGMGVVDLGITTDGDLVAVKSLRGGAIGGTDGRARFEREIAAMQRVQGPRVAEVVDADAAADPPYVVTRYVRGISLSKVVADHGPLRGDALCRLAAGLVEALSSVHAAGIVHRDVKPANVLLTDDGPILIDFGLAHAIGDTRLTTVGMIAGTPGYLAPEIAYGHEATFATDIHGWAATVAFAAKGRSPYGNGPDAVILDRIRRGDHDVQDIPEPFTSLVARGLHVDPGSRPPLSDIGAALGVEETMALVVAESSATGRAGAAANGVAASTRETQVVDASATSVHPAAVDEPPRRHPSPRPPAPTRPWQPRLVIGVGAFVLLVLGCVWPYVGAASLFVVILTGRVTWRLLRRLHERRADAGPRRGDRVIAALASPVDVGASVVPAAVETVLVVVTGYLAGAALNTLDLEIPGWELAPFIVGGVVALTLSWWGPGAEKFRYGVRTLVAPLATTPRVTWAFVGVFVAAGWTLALLWDQWGTTWWPAGGPVDPFA